MSRIIPIVLIALLLPSFLPMTTATTGRAVNIDLDVADISITYPDSTNQSLYQMFSSNYPISSFNKPENLYVTDGVIGVEMNINIVIDNIGTVQSGFIDVVVLVLHNEYTRFELLNDTKTLSPISGSSSGSLDVLWTPYYSGNHTLQIIVSNTNGDDDTSNNQLSRHLTVAYLYDNCVDMSQWTSSGEWSVNSDAFISQSNSFHVGNGQLSTYSSSQSSVLTSPTFNLADDINNHNAAIGYSFFYTGGAGAGDQMKGYIKDDMGNWDETFTMQNTVDNNFQDGISWQTFSASYSGQTSPLIPVDNSHFHSSTQIQFSFTSDASDSDIGYWIDDIVIIYDQAARKSEYQVSVTGVNALGGLPGDWSTTRLEVTNDGNISARYTPTASGIPNEWTHYFSNPNGASIGSSGLELLPGESRQFDLRVLVDENASQGNLPVTVNVTSNLHSDIMHGIQTVLKVLPDRLPEIVLPEVTPRCSPGTSCDFPIEIKNVGEATDVFTLSLEDKNIPTGWSIALAWNQSTNVLVRVDTPVQIWLTSTIPEGVEPDVTGESWLTATSTNDSRRSDLEVVEVAAAMISEAEISVEPQIQNTGYIDAGQSKDITFRIWNNASRIDIFRPHIDYTDITGWSVELLNTPDLAISPGSSSTYTVRVSAPITAQADDLGPLVSPKALSMRSGEIITGDGWQGLHVNSLHDLSLQLVDTPTTLTPGVPMMLSIEITNSGNGPATAVIDLPWSPSTWVWWALIDGVNVTDGVPLSVSYDLENVKTVDIWLILPSLEAPGEFHEITISVQPNNGDDINSSDNSVMFEAITATIRQPRLDGYSDEEVVETDSTFSFNATAWNIGNAADNTIRARLVLQTSPASMNVIGFLSTSTGLSKSAGEWINLNLGATESIDLLGDIIISSDCDINTIISATIELEGGSDDLGRPILKTISVALMVGQRRHVELESIESPVDEIQLDSNHILWINLSSTSTQNEIFEVEAVVPVGWGIICDGNPVHIEMTRIEMDQGHLTTQSHDMRCEVIRESGDFTGKLELMINGSDDRINYQISNQISWEQPTENEEMFSNTIIASGIGGATVLIAIGLFLRRYGYEDDDDEYDDQIIEDQVPVQGPPATMFSGPPATNQFVEDAPTEYELQVEEYNRKVAEYEAWQSTQGSQAVVDTPTYE